MNSTFNRNCIKLISHGVIHSHEVNPKSNLTFICHVICIFKLTQELTSACTEYNAILFYR